MSGDPLRWVRPELLDVPGYEPVEPPMVLARRLGLSEDQIVKLDANENPYGPSPRALAALADYRGFHIYPDPEHRRVREALAQHLGLGAEYIVAGSGSDDLLDVVTRMTLAPGDAAVDNVPTFGMYPFVVQIAGGHLIKVRRRHDFSIDIAAVEEAVAQGAKLIFVASPNNPTGNLPSPQEVEALLGLDALVVLDEAYTEFSGHSYVHLVPERPNLIVLRTFSKWAALAGLRAGYGVMPRALAQLARRVKMPYNLNTAAEVAILASLEDAPSLMAWVEAIVQERQRLLRELAAVPFLRPFSSSGNFILCQVSDTEARGLWRRLREMGIIIRYYDTPLLRNCVRISVGRPQDTDRLMAALRQIEEEVHGSA
ncbi:MAG: histidinol-phosphate transaminase [Dehalococcoidia bacterium]